MPTQIIQSPGITKIFEVAKQGVPGPPGPPGSAGAAFIQIPAPADIGGNRVVIDSGEYADNTDPMHVGRVIGITTSAVTVGQASSIQVSGELTGFSGLTVGRIYLSTNGLITQTAPTAGMVQQLGNAINATTILINISQPIQQV